MIDFTECAFNGCSASATWRPIFSFAAKSHPLGTRAKFALPLAVCDEHAASDPAAFISDAGWQQIVEGFRQRGLGEPDRSTLTVEFCGFPWETVGDRQ
jgi:hypothetical protein